jgi:hypothetical protein
VETVDPSVTAHRRSAARRAGMPAEQIPKKQRLGLGAWCAIIWLRW